MSFWNIIKKVNADTTPINETVKQIHVILDELEDLQKFNLSKIEQIEDIEIQTIFYKKLGLSFSLKSHRKLKAEILDYENVLRGVI